MHRALWPPPHLLPASERLMTRCQVQPHLYQPHSIPPHLLRTSTVDNTFE